MSASLTGFGRALPEQPPTMMTRTLRYQAVAEWLDHDGPRTDTIHLTDVATVYENVATVREFVESDVVHGTWDALITVLRHLSRPVSAVRRTLAQLSDVAAYYFYYSVRWALRLVEYARGPDA